MTAPLIQYEDVSITLSTAEGRGTVVRDLDFQIEAGESVALVGESGSGKTITARSMIRLLPESARVQGQIKFEGKDVLQMGRKELRDLRGPRIGMIFQDPKAAINPVRTVGDFLTERLRTQGVGRKEAEGRATALLDRVGVDRAEKRLRQYPFEFSGGLLQRVMIASVLLADPEVILADEPTTALDVTTQAEVMALLDEIRKERDLTLLMITHDLELAAAVCGRTLVMYAGTIVEDSDADLIDVGGLHPYTNALLESRPRLDQKQDELVSIPGRAVSGLDAPAGCPFAPRCAFRIDQCEAERPPLRLLDGTRVACIRAEEIRGGSAK